MNEDCEGCQELYAMLQEERKKNGRLKRDISKYHKQYMEMQARLKEQIQLNMKYSKPIAVINRQTRAIEQNIAKRKEQINLEETLLDESE